MRVPGTERGSSIPVEWGWRVDGDPVVLPEPVYIRSVLKNFDFLKGGVFSRSYTVGPRDYGPLPSDRDQHTKAQIPRPGKGESVDHCL